MPTRLQQSQSASLKKINGAIAYTWTEGQTEGGIQKEKSYRKYKGHGHDEGCEGRAMSTTSFWTLPPPLHASYKCND